MLPQRGFLLVLLSYGAALASGEVAQGSAQVATAAGKLRAFGQALQKERNGLKAEAARLHAVEAAEVQRSKELDQREAALQRKEQEAAALQSELLKEQRKVWQWLHPAGSSAGAVEKKLRRPKVALLQRDAVATTAADRSRVGSGSASAAQGGAAVAQKKPRKLFGSDVGLVQAAGMVPKEDIPPPKADPWENSAGGQEDDTEVSEDAKLGENADNDNLLPDINAGNSE